MSISFATVTEVIFAKYWIKISAKLLFCCLFARHLKNKIGIIIIAHLLHALFPKIYKLFNFTKCKFYSNYYSQISVLLTYIEGRQMVGPKLLNLHFERQWVLFQLLVNTKMEKSGIRFGNRTGCRCNNNPGVKVMEYYPLSFYQLN